MVPFVILAAGLFLAATVVFLVAFGATAQKLRRFKDSVQIVALIFAGTLTVYWTYMTYVRPDVLRPDKYVPDVLIQPTFSLIQALPNRADISLNVRIANQSEVFIVNVGAWYEVVGMRAENKEIENEDLLNTAVSTLNNRKIGHSPIDIHRLPRNTVGTVAIGRILPNEWWLSPGEEQITQIILSAPRSMDLLKVVVHVHYQKSRERVFEIRWKNDEGQIKAHPWIIKDNEIFDHRRNQDHDRLHKRHGLAWATASHEFAIPIEAGQTGKFVEQSSE